MGSSKHFSTRSYSGLRRLALCTLLAAVSASLIACAPSYVLAPDSPMLILEARGKSHIAAMVDGKMVDLGWIDSRELNGLTAVDFDWSDEIAP
jgi:hypothetical protein